MNQHLRDSFLPKHWESSFFPLRGCVSLWIGMPGILLPPPHRAGRERLFCTWGQTAQPLPGLWHQGSKPSPARAFCGFCFSRCPQRGFLLLLPSTDYKGSNLSFIPSRQSLAPTSQGRRFWLCKARDKTPTPLNFS